MLTRYRQLPIFLGMNFEDTLRRYRQDRFTDSDIKRCTGLTVRAWREVLRLRVVQTSTEGLGRGRIRWCDATVFKRATVIAALNHAGFNLGVAGKIAYFFPFHTLLFKICDPDTILFHCSADVDPETGLPPRVKEPITNWFDLDKPAQADRQTDWLIDIYNGRFVGGIYNASDGPTIFGDLRNEGTQFVSWYPLHQRPQFNKSTKEIVRTLPYHRFVDFVADWENPLKFPKQHRRLGYKYEKHDTDEDPLRLAADAIARSPIFTTSINVSLAIRKSLRRYLELEPPLPDF